MPDRKLAGLVDEYFTEGTTPSGMRKKIQRNMAARGEHSALPEQYSVLEKFVDWVDDPSHQERKLAAGGIRDYFQDILRDQESDYITLASAALDSTLGVDDAISKGVAAAITSAGPIWVSRKMLDGAPMPAMRRRQAGILAPIDERKSSRDQVGLARELRNAIDEGQMTQEDAWREHGITYLPDYPWYRDRRDLGLMERPASHIILTPRFEIPDTDIAISEKHLDQMRNGYNVGLGDFLGHEEMFAEIPRLRELTVRKAGDMPSDMVASFRRDGPIPYEIKMNERHLGDAEALKKPLIHEIQHGIQDIYVLPPGGTADELSEYLAHGDVDYTLIRVHNDYLDQLAAIKADPKLSQHQKERAISDAQHQLYMRLAGEKEAHAVMDRVGRDADWLRDHNPSASPRYEDMVDSILPRQTR